MARAPLLGRDVEGEASSRPWSGGWAGDEDTLVEGVAGLAEAVVAVLEGDDSWATGVAGDVGVDVAVVLAKALARNGLRARCGAPLRGGGQAELLVTTDAYGAPMVAVVSAVRGATDALSARVRRLASHREVDAVVIASPRVRHQALAGELQDVPVLVAMLPTTSSS